MHLRRLQALADVAEVRRRTERRHLHLDQRDRAVGRVERHGGENLQATQLRKHNALHTRHRPGDETVQCNAMQCNEMQCNAMQCNATRHNKHNKTQHKASGTTDCISRARRGTHLVDVIHKSAAVPRVHVKLEANDVAGVHLQAPRATELTQHGQRQLQDAHPCAAAPLSNAVTTCRAGKSGRCTR